MQASGSRTLEALVLELRERVERLERENAALRAGDVREGGAEDAVSRRRLLKGAGVAAAGLALAAADGLLGAHPAAATTGAMQYGVGNDAGSDSTSLTSTSGSGTLLLTNTGTGVTLVAVSVGAAGAIYAADETSDNPGIEGQASGTGAAPAIEGTADNFGSNAIHGKTTNASNTQPTILGETNGSSAGVWGDITGGGLAGVVGRTVSSGRGVWGQALKGTGEGVFGQVVPSKSKAAAVHGQTAGSGPGVLAQSTKGRGVVSHSEHAQIQLAPAMRPTHPTNGKTGDLFCDHRGRLWFCSKGGASATWNRLA